MCVLVCWCVGGCASADVEESVVRIGRKSHNIAHVM